MELDVEVHLENLPRPIALELAKCFPVELGEVTSDVVRDVVVRPASESHVVTDVEIGIRAFLQSLTMYSEAIKKSRGALRLGIFYDLRETVVFPFRLSAEIVKTIGELNLSIDATGYPCAEESEDPA